MSKENRVSDERLAEMIAAMENHGAAKLATIYTADYLAAITELQSLRSKPVAGVEVKPLEWGKTSYGRPETETIVGVYRVFEHVDGGWAATFKTFNLVDANGRKNFATEAEALDAAEADYRQRILSALIPKATAPVVSEPVATIDRAMDCDSWPEWLGDIVDLAIQASDAADMSTEQAIAYAILHYAASPQPEAVITEEIVERAAKWMALDHVGISDRAEYSWDATDDLWKDAWRKKARSLTAALKEA